MIRDALNDAWNHSRAITVQLANGATYQGVPQRAAIDAEWCELHDYSRYHTVPMKVHRIRIGDIVAMTGAQ